MKIWKFFVFCFVLFAIDVVAEVEEKVYHVPGFGIGGNRVFMVESPQSL